MHFMNGIINKSKSHEHQKRDRAFLYPGSQGVLHQAKQKVRQSIRNLKQSDGSPQIGKTIKQFRKLKTF